MKEIFFTREDKIKITTGGDNKGVEIGRDAIRAGFLKKLPGPSLSILLYLLTHTENGVTVSTDPSTIASFLPCNLNDINEGLNYLNNNKIISINKASGKISLHLDNLKIGNSVQETNEDNNSDLKDKLKTYIPPQENTQIIDQWLKDFDNKLLEELTRRVDKWFNKQRFNQTPENKFYYLMGIIDDWYKKEIYTYKRLKHFDRLYRETKSLAEIYGFKNWQKLSKVHMETFRNWISGKNGLSFSLAKYAIKEAIKRKKDGQPSLKYIEDNFVRPFKQAGIQNINQACKFLNNKNSNKKNKSQKKSKNKLEQWNEFPWNFNDFQEV